MLVGEGSQKEQVHATKQQANVWTLLVCWLRMLRNDPKVRTMPRLPRLPRLLQNAKTFAERIYHSSLRAVHCSLKIFLTYQPSIPQNDLRYYTCLMRPDLFGSSQDTIETLYLFGKVPELSC